MNNKILFFPQNNEHILNMNPVFDILTEKGLHCEYIDTRKVYNQPLNFNPKHELAEVTLPEIETSFYQLNSLDRIMYLRTIIKTVAKLTSQYDLIVFGNDGAIQRIINYHAKKKGKVTVMILDGLVGSSKYSYKDIFLYSKEKTKDIKQKIIKDLKYTISKRFSGTFLSPYLPSTIGSSNLNEIYTIGEFSKSYINSHKHKLTKVFSYGLPRMKTHFFNNEVSFAPKMHKSVCFITSAYKWHNLEHFHEFQIQDILMIHQCLQDIYPKDNKAILYIKLHPREREEDYAFIKNYKHMQLVTDEPLTSTFANYSVFYSNISTCIVEGLNRGIIVNSVMINFPYWKFKNSFLKDPSIHKIFTKEEMIKTLKESLEKETINYKNISENNFLTKETINSVENISNNILQLV